VKISASSEGAVLMLGGTSDPTNIQLVADGNETFLTMTDKDGKRQRLKPGRRNEPTQYYPSR
jgi:hypothetical protein